MTNHREDRELAKAGMHIEEINVRKVAAAATVDGVEKAGDPEGYVGADGKAAPHEQPWEVREHYDEAVEAVVEKTGETPKT